MLNSTVAHSDQYFVAWHQFALFVFSPFVLADVFGNPFHLFLGSIAASYTILHERSDYRFR